MRDHSLTGRVATDAHPRGSLAGPPFEGIAVPPVWTILPPGKAAPDSGIPIIIVPGAGFGIGTHETTQLCLQAVHALAPCRDTGPGAARWTMLDFGSGSGILSIGAAKLGASVDAVEIDELAIANAEDNVRLNGVADRIRHSSELTEAPGPFDLIVANILRTVLTRFAPQLAARLGAHGTLVLSGLVATDVPEVSVCYAAHLGQRRPEVYARGEWRALVWRGSRPK